MTAIETHIRLRDGLYWVRYPGAKETSHATPEEARAVLFDAEIDGWRDVSGSGQAVMPHTLRQLVIAHLAQQKRLRNARYYRQSCLYYLREWLAWTLAEWRIESPRELQAQHIEAFVARLDADAKGARTVNVYLNHIGCLYNTAIKRYRGQVVEFNPAQAVNRKREVRGERQILTSEEANAILARAAGTAWGTFFAVVLGTGCRLAEAAHLRWDRVDLDRKSIRIAEDPESGWRPKTKRSYRTIPLSGLALEAVQKEYARRSSSVYVFATKAGGPRCNNALTALKRYARAVGIEHITVHALRHTYASWLLAAGVDVATVAKLLGHSTITVTSIYLHAIDAKFKAAPAAIDAMLGRPGVPAAEKHSPMGSMEALGPARIVPMPSRDKVISMVGDTGLEPVTSCVSSRQDGNGVRASGGVAPVTRFRRRIGPISLHLAGARSRVPHD